MPDLNRVTILLKNACREKINKVLQVGIRGDFAHSDLVLNHISGNRLSKLAIKTRMKLVINFNM